MKNMFWLRYVYNEIIFFMLAWFQYILFLLQITTPLFCKVIEKSKRQNFQREKLLGLLWNCCNSWIIDQANGKSLYWIQQKVLHISNCLKKVETKYILLSHQYTSCTFLGFHLSDYIYVCAKSHRMLGHHYMA